MGLSAVAGAVPGSPVNPQSSHTEECSNDMTVEISWYPPEGDVIGGYSVLWDTQPATLPDPVITTAEPRTVSPFLSAGTAHYVHIRASDTAGVWSDTALHAGPFCIELSDIPGDINNDKTVSLSDAVLALKLISFTDVGSENIQISADVNQDQKIGLPEAVYILKKIATAVPSECLSPEEAELARLINEYRKANNKTELAVSKSLTLTAQWHVIDLDQNRPDSVPNCNMHSWSDQGAGLWTPVCFDTANPPTDWSGMSRKPAEISGNAYTGDAYEIAYWNPYEINPAQTLEAWKKSPTHNDVILKQNNWVNLPGEWSVMGVGIYRNYAAAWFGVNADPGGVPEACGN